MAWETDQHGRTRYVQKLRLDGRITSKVLGTGESDHAAEQQLFIDRTTKSERRAEEHQRKTKLDLSVEAAKQIVEQTMICNGFIKRNGSWRLIRRLATPLTPQEVTHIRRIKRAARPKLGNSKAPLPLFEREVVEPDPLNQNETAR